MEEQQRQLLFSPVVTESAPADAEKISPWGQKHKGGSAQPPRYTLPPPPHPIHDDGPSPSLLTAKPKPKSLQEIMAEESRMLKKAPFQLPAGSAPAMKSPPWATASARLSVIPISSTASTAPTTPSGKHSLGDFINERPTPKASLPKPVGWASPKTTPSPSKALTPVSPALSFREIQEQEQDFKTKQDKNYAEGGKWFIERRERAGSFREIQSETVQETEEQRFVEEQIEIEKQIYEQLAAQKAAEDSKSQKKGQGTTRKKNSRKTKPKNSATRENAASSAIAPNVDDAKPKPRPKKRPSKKPGEKSYSTTPGGPKPSK